MCGINGIYAYNPAAGAPDEREVLATRDAMRARGPDGCGVWWSPDRRAALGHRRLAIQDLSERGAQPMASESGRLVVTFNGEIYNYPALREELEGEGVRFRSTADTEVLLHLYEREGEAMVHRLRGMFAFAIWDARDQSLFLARDPYGIKPLYTSDDGWHFRFASQVRALVAGGRVSRDPEPAGVVGFHLWGSVPEPFTMYRAIRSLPAGHTQRVDSTGPEKPRSYASIAGILREAMQRPVPEVDVKSTAERALRESVAAHLLSDVPVGVFLSAGVDSGALLGLVRDADRKRGELHAVTLGFNEFRGTDNDEVPLAATMAECYGARHHVRLVSAEEFRRDLPAILDAMDQPSIDGINTWFVSKAAREVGLKVALSGLGGDELVGGYPSFRDVPRWRSWMRIPGAMPGLGAAVRRVGRAVGAMYRVPKALGLAEFAGTYAGAYYLRRGLFMPFELETKLAPDILRDGLRRLRNVQRVASTALDPDPGVDHARVTALESVWYMRNQLLRDADWAGMAHSLEIRTPLVDVEVLRAFGTIMGSMAPGRGKQLIAESPSLALPTRIVQRAKTGFSVPATSWLTGGGQSPSLGESSRQWGVSVFSHHQGSRVAVPA
jgi:asparagine synthase (glutamine-hydrolysing)